MNRRKRRFWDDDEKHRIVAQTLVESDGGKAEGSPFQLYGDRHGCAVRSWAIVEGLM